MKTKIFGLLVVLLSLALVTGCTPITDTPDVPEETTYTVTIISESTNGTVSADKTDKIAAGETITLTVTPNDGYELESLSVVDSSSNPITTTSNTFTMPASNVTVDATFTKTAETLNQEAADAVIAKIKAIGEVSYTPESKKKIDDARSAYDALTAEQKDLVTNYSTLTAAESTYTSLIPPTTANYTVKHLQQNLLNDDYKEVTKDTQTLNGTIGAQTAAVAKAYTGFTAQEFVQKTIEAGGTTVVEIRYTRNTYTVSFENETGENLNLPQNGTYKYGKTISVNPNVLNSTVAYIVWTDGTNEYNTDGYNNTFEITVSGNVTLTAKELWFKAGATVEFYYRTPSGVEVKSDLKTKSDIDFFSINDAKEIIALKRDIKKEDLENVLVKDSSSDDKLFWVGDSYHDYMYTIAEYNTESDFDTIYYYNKIIIGTPLKLLYKGSDDVDKTTKRVLVR